MNPNSPPHPLPLPPATRAKRELPGDREDLRVHINRLIGQALHEYELIRAGDRILVAVSGGKDSLTMLHFLMEFQKKAPVPFDLWAVNVDQGQPGFPAEVLPRLFAEWNVPFHVERQDTYSVVLEKTAPGKTFCAVCSRLRRGILYRLARERGCNKIALGHHRDDLIQTFLLNGFFSGQLGTMTPIYTVEQGDLQVIRPLFAVPEDWIARFAALCEWPIVPCNLCGSQEGLKRLEMARLLAELEAKFPEVKNSLFRALGNPHPEQLLDRGLWQNPAAATPRSAALPDDLD